MWQRLMRTGLVCAALVAVGGAAAAQTPFLLLPQQDLSFGLLTPGVPAAVAPTDVSRRAGLLLQGRGTTSVVFVLPDQLESATGQAIPLVYSATDGLVVIKNRGTRFDPRQSLTVKLTPGEPEAGLYLGATAQPSAGQLAGLYTATITVLIVPSGT